MRKQRFLVNIILTAVAIWAGGCAESWNAAQFNDTPPKRGIDDPFNPDRPPTVKTLYLWADILVAQGRDAQAEAVFKMIHMDYPDFLPVYNDLAALQMRQRRIPEAIQTLSAGLAVSPQNPVFLNNIGMCWLIRMDYNKALEYFTQAAAVAPDKSRYQSNMATALGLLGRQEESLSLYRRILPEEEATKNIELVKERIGMSEPYGRL